jgi:transketolase
METISKSERHAPYILILILIILASGIEQGWSKWLGDKGVFIGMSSFGTSAPAKNCYEKFGITVANTIAATKKLKT